MTAVCGGASGKASFWKLDMRASVEGLLLVAKSRWAASVRKHCRQPSKLPSHEDAVGVFNVSSKGPAALESKLSVQRVGWSKGLH